MKTSYSCVPPAKKARLDPNYVFAELLKLEEDNSPLPKVFAFFSVAELLKMKKVCRKWRAMCTRSINNKCPDPPNPLQSNQELKDAITKWCTYDPEAMEELACTYGYPINKWDVSRVTDFSFVFYNKRNFNEYIGDWDVSNAITMAGMFWYAGAFNQPLTNWNTSKVTTMNCMFSWAESFNQPVNHFDTSRVTNMGFMFHDASAFNQPVNHFDTSQVTNMYSMFEHATAFNQSLASWNCSSVTGRWRMFSHATSFTHFDTLPDELREWEQED